MICPGLVTKLRWVVLTMDEHDLAQEGFEHVRIIRSLRRKKTIQAREKGDTLEILAPQWMTAKELNPVIKKLARRIHNQKRANNMDHGTLETRAQTLNQRYFDGVFRWSSIRWVTNQNGRYGSCTPATGRIRISHRIASMPRFVQDYVIIHEMAHLVEPRHDQRFWELLAKFPKTERARGYLMAVGLEDMEMGSE